MLRGQCAKPSCNYGTVNDSSLLFIVGLDTHPVKEELLLCYRLNPCCTLLVLYRREGVGIVINGLLLVGLDYNSIYKYGMESRLLLMGKGDHSLLPCKSAYFKNVPPILLFALIVGELA